MNIFFLNFWTPYLKGLNLMTLAVRLYGARIIIMGILFFCALHNTTFIVDTTVVTAHHFVN